MDDRVLLNRVTTTYLGENRVRIAAGERTFQANRRTDLPALGSPGDRPGAGFCPLELVAAALGA